MASTGIRPRTSVVVAAVAVVVLIAACSTSGAGITAPTPAPASTPPSASLPSGAPSTPADLPGVRTRTLDITDPSRSTDPTPGTPEDAEPGRHLPTTLYYPADPAGPLPLVVFSHGMGGNAAAFADLLQSWAAAGFVIAAPTFPLTSAGTAGVFDDVVNQPADVSFVLGSVLALDRAPGDELAGRIDPDRIAAAGYSAGGITTLGLLLACCRDPRITAAVVLEGTADPLPLRYADPPVPVLFVHGSRDETIPIEDSERAYAAAEGPKAFVELVDATHAGPFGEPAPPSYPVVVSVTTDFLRWNLAGDAAGADRLRADATVAGVSRLTGDEL